MKHKGKVIWLVSFIYYIILFQVQSKTKKVNMQTGIF